MELDKLSQVLDNLLKKFNATENQVTYLRQRESKLLANIDNLQAQLANAETKIQQIVTRLKAVEEQV